MNLLDAYNQAETDMTEAWGQICTIRYQVAALESQLTDAQRKYDEAHQRYSTLQRAIVLTQREERR